MKKESFVFGSIETRRFAFEIKWTLVKTGMHRLGFKSKYMMVRGFRWFLDFKVSRGLQFLEYLRTLCLKGEMHKKVNDKVKPKFQKVRTKIEVVLSLPSWLPQILVGAFWNFKRKVLKYNRNCSFDTLIPNLVKPLMMVNHFDEMKINQK